MRPYQAVRYNLLLATQGQSAAEAWLKADNDALVGARVVCVFWRGERTYVPRNEGESERHAVERFLASCDE